MNIKSNQILRGVQSLKGFIYSVLPSRQLSWWIDVVSLHVWSEVLLWLGVELNHSFSEWISIGPKWRDFLEHGSIEGTVDLLERLWTWEIDEDERAMSQESIGQRMSTSISGRVTSTDELDSFQFDPLLVLRSPEAILLSDLSQESNDSLCTILVSVGKINFITENNQPFVRLMRS